MSIFLAKDLDDIVSKTKGTDIFNKMLLSQYGNSTNFKAYAGAFLKQFDELLETQERSYLGRFLEYATGKQLDTLGKIVGMSSEIKIEAPNFGFFQDITAGGFGTVGDPLEGEVFASIGDPSRTLALSDITFRRAIRAKALCNGTDVQDVEFMYEIISILLDIEPAFVNLQAELDIPNSIFFGFEEDDSLDVAGFGTVGDIAVGGVFSSLTPSYEVTTTEPHRITLSLPTGTDSVSLNLIKVMKPYFIPAGYKLVVNLI